jgi:uncharacterized protein
MHSAIAQHTNAITSICQRFHIKRLDVFGSAARANDFIPDTSDADFLVEFAADAQPGLQNFFDAKAALETVLGREVDLIESGSIKNPFVLASINAHKESVYAA